MLSFFFRLYFNDHSYLVCFFICIYIYEYKYAYMNENVSFEQVPTVLLFLLKNIVMMTRKRKTTETKYKSQK